MNIPDDIRLHKKSQRLALQYGEQTYFLPAEYLRVYSPSAEVMGHGPNEKKLQYGKQFVAMTQIEAQGNYALRIYFDDGHDTGLYTWDYLYQLAIKQPEMWQRYLDELNQAQKSRDPSEATVQLIDPKPTAP